jgi:hypothetical protein
VPHNELPDPKVLLVPDFVNAYKGVSVSFSFSSPLSVLFPENAGVLTEEDYESAAYSIPGWDYDATKELVDALEPHFKDEEFRKIAPGILEALSEPRDPYNPDDAPALKRQRTAAAAAAAALVRTHGDVAAAVELLRL